MSKREVNKKIVDTAMNLLDLPPSTTPEGHADYLRVKRRLETIIVKQPLSLRQFWFDVNIAKKDLWNLEAEGLLRKKKR
jgi:hypothetical protein